MKKPTIILINDTDHLSYKHACIVFGVLNSFDIPFTHATFYTLEDRDEFKNHLNSLAKHCRKRETASFTDEDGEKYRSLLNHQIDLGNEIAYHGYSQVSNKRPDFQKGIELINNSLNQKMVSYIEHGGNLSHHPISGCKFETLDIQGGKIDSEYFVKDLIKDNFKYVWSYFDLVSPKNNFKVEDLLLSLETPTFYQKDNIKMMKRYRAHDVVKILNEKKLSKDDVIIAYTHFGYCGYPQGTPLESWYTYQDVHKNCVYLDSLRKQGYNLTTLRKYFGD